MTKFQAMRSCPACTDVIMLKFRDPDTGLEIDSCPECYGLWFDGEELKLFFHSPSLSEKILQADGLTPKPEEVHRRPEQGRERTCPQCQGQLLPTKVGQTQIDYCLGCRGIWFDHREIQDIVAAYGKGERGNLLVINQLAEGLGTQHRPNPEAHQFFEALKRYEATL